jgi:hypothetical protein
MRSNTAVRFIAGATVAAAVGIGLGACSSGSPATASQVLTGDGYTAMSNNLLPASDLAAITPYTTSLAYGTNSAGNIEIVMVVKPSELSTLQAGLNAEVASLGSGVHDSVNGDVVRLSGPVSAFGG